MSVDVLVPILAPLPRPVSHAVVTIIKIPFCLVHSTRQSFFQLLLLFCSVLCLSLPSATAVVTAGAPTPVGRSMMLPFGFFLLFMRRRFAFVMKVAGLLLFLLPTTIFPIVCVCPSENLHKHQFVFECVHEFLYQTVFYDFQFFRSSPDSTGLTACTSGWVCVSVWDPHSSTPTNSHIVDME